MNDKVYCVRDEDTGKLVSNITNPRRKYWDRKGNAESAIRNAKGRYYKDPRNLKLVTFELVEVEGD